MYAHHLEQWATRQSTNKRFFGKKLVLLSSVMASSLFVSLPSVAATLHEVEAGENLTVIAHKYGITVDDLVRVNGIQRTASIMPSQLLSIPDDTDRVSSSIAANRLTNNNYTGRVEGYIIQRGDNLTTLANRYGVSVEALASINRISPQAAIFTGQKLMVPATSIANVSTVTTKRTPRSSDDTSYKVKSGNTLSGIAESYGMSVAELARANNVATNYLVKAGEMLVIPGTSTGLSASQTVAQVSTSKNKNTTINNSPQNNVYQTAPNQVSHKVQYGETLTGLAARYKIPLSTLASANNVPTDYMLINGQTIIIPGVTQVITAPISARFSSTNASTKTTTPNTHKVKVGEGLIGISNKYKVNLNELAKLNGMDAYDHVQIGQVLKLPSNAVAPDSSNATSSSDTY